MRKLVGSLVMGMLLGGAVEARGESLIAFEGRKGDLGFGAKQIFVMNPDGTNLSNISNNAFDDTHPSWSPDGRRILFFSNRAGSTDVYSMDADGSNVTRLTTNASVDQDGATINWSPELPPSVTSLSPFGQTLSAFFLGVIATLMLLRQRGLLNPPT